MPTRPPDQARLGPASPGTGNTDEVVTAVLAACRLLVEVSARSLTSVKAALTLPQFRMLAVLDSRGAMNISRLGEHLDVGPATAMRMIDRLVAAGMLDRAINPANRRETLIDLTCAGRHVVHQTTKRRRDEFARIVGTMPPEQRASLIEALHAFTRGGREPLAHADPSLDVGW
jgi:DNA-binding MarR family transcriptional regulator